MYLVDIVPWITAMSMPKHSHYYYSLSETFARRTVEQYNNSNCFMHIAQATVAPNNLNIMLFVVL